MLLLLFNPLMLSHIFSNVSNTRIHLKSQKKKDFLNNDANLTTTKTHHQEEFMTKPLL